MIGPFTRFTDGTHHLTHDVYVSGEDATERGMFIPSEATRAMAFRRAMDRHLLALMPLNFVGACIVLPSRDRDHELRIERTALYSLVAPEEFIVGIEAHVQHIAKVGAGDVYFTGEPVHVIKDEGRVRCGFLKGSVPGDNPVIWIRTFFGHEKQAVRWYTRAGALADPLDREIDGVRLRDLLVWDEGNRRDRMPRMVLRPAQREAVAAHLSAELAKRVVDSDRETKRRDRMQVVVDLDDDD